MSQYVELELRHAILQKPSNTTLVSTILSKNFFRWQSRHQSLRSFSVAALKINYQDKDIQNASSPQFTPFTTSCRWNTSLSGLRQKAHQAAPGARIENKYRPTITNYSSLSFAASKFKSTSTRSTSSASSKSKKDTARVGENVAKTPSAPSTSSHPILNRLPPFHYLHRPSKEELLAAATGFWSRLKVRFKWATIRSVRPFNMDEIYAVFSWILFGHFVWIIVGTTTFFSLAILFVNTVFAQETLARWIGNYITKSSGLKVVFESAIVPKWSNGVISFKRVFVSRRPGQGSSNVSKGSQSTAAAAAAASAARTDDIIDVQTEDTNYTQFDLSIDSVDVTLSFTKWFNGKGLLRDVEVSGVRGVIDRTLLKQPPTDIDPRSYRHHHHTGDFELDSFKLEDLLVTVYQPGKFRPFSVSIYTCELPRLRQQWLFYDFLCANNVSGSFDDSLFAIHPRQIHGITGARLQDGVEPGHGIEWKKHSRIQIDGLSIDHLNRGVDGPFSWIYEGNVDIAADVMIPPETDDSIAKVMSDVYDRVEATVTSNHDKIGGRDGDEDLAEGSKPIGSIANERYVICDVRVQLNDVRAAVPLFTHAISYVNNAMIRPIVAYINSRRMFIPINCRVVERVSDFDGSWTIYDSGLLKDLSREMYDAFARDVADNEARSRRLRKVGIWTMQLAAQAFFIGLAGSIA